MSPDSIAQAPFSEPSQVLPFVAHPSRFIDSEAYKVIQADT